jgi:HK97 family phage major capsid protein
MLTIEQLIEKQAEANAQIATAVKALHESITAAQAGHAKSQPEIDKLVTEITDLKGQLKALQSPAVRKMAWLKSGNTAPEGVEGVRFNKFLKAVNDKDNAFLREMKAATGNSEDVNADGGYLVPVEFANEIIKLERQSSIVRGLCRVLPMSSKTRTFPKELTKPNVYWVGEATEPTKSKGTVDQLTQTAKKLMAIITLTEELLEDDATNYDAFIAEVVAQEMGREEDKQALVGCAGNSDPFVGVHFASGVTEVLLEGAGLAYPDLVNVKMGPRAPYRGRGQWILSTTALKKVMKLVDDHNRPVWSDFANGNPGRILGQPYNETDQIPDTLGAASRTTGTDTAILYGAWDALMISPRGQYTVKASDSASDSAGKSAFTLDEVWFKMRRRQSINVVNGEAFSKLALPAA